MILCTPFGLCQTPQFTEKRHNSFCPWKIFFPFFSMTKIVQFSYVKSQIYAQNIKYSKSYIQTYWKKEMQHNFFSIYNSRQIIFLLFNDNFFLAFCILFLFSEGNSKSTFHIRIWKKMKSFIHNFFPTSSCIFIH